MAFAVEEQLDSRSMTSGRNPAVELRYDVVQTDYVAGTAPDDGGAYRAAEDAIPGEFDLFHNGLSILPFAALTLTPHKNTPGLWAAVAAYNIDTGGYGDDQVVRFSVTGGVEHITRSLRTKRYGAKAPDFKGLIGVTSNGVEGVDVDVPISKFSLPCRRAAVDVTNVWERQLNRLVNHVNAAIFRGYERGEVKFLGADGERAGFGDYEFLYHFAMIENRTDMEVDDITGIDKEGWEYLWIHSQEEEVDGRLIKKPIGVYVEQVCRYGDFSILGLL